MICKLNSISYSVALIQVSEMCKCAVAAVRRGSSPEPKPGADSCCSADKTLHHSPLGGTMQQPKRKRDQNQPKVPKAARSVTWAAGKYCRLTCAGDHLCWGPPVLGTTCAGDHAHS